MAMHDINALERRIVKAEDDADAMLWEQARQVAESVLSDRQLARQWMNGRTGKPYSRAHVYWTKLTHGHYGGQSPRPQFRKAYELVKKRVTAPSTPEPFHWMLAVGDLVRTVEKMIDAWPESVRECAPRALRNLADSLEAEHVGGQDVSRRHRIEATSAATPLAVPDGVRRAS